MSTNPTAAQSNASAQLATVQSPDLTKKKYSYADRTIWRSVLKWPDSCEIGFHYPDKSFGGVEVYTLSDKQRLVQVTCTLGAYQGAYRFYVMDSLPQAMEPHELTFEVLEDSGEAVPNRIQREQTAEVNGTPEFDGTTRQIVVLDKFRGLGDCGLLSRYSITEHRTKLEEVRGKLDCDGKGPTDPKRWPRLPSSIGKKPPSATE